jgi:hypothetical protein
MKFELVLAKQVQHGFCNEFGKGVMGGYERSSNSWSDIVNSFPQNETS